MAMPFTTEYLISLRPNVCPVIKELFTLILSINSAVFPFFDEPAFALAAFFGGVAVFALLVFWSAAFLGAAFFAGTAFFFIHKILNAYSVIGFSANSVNW